MSYLVTLPHVARRCDMLPHRSHVVLSSVLASLVTLPYVVVCDPMEACLFLSCAKLSDVM